MLDKMSKQFSQFFPVVFVGIKGAANGNVSGYRPIESFS